MSIVLLSPLSGWAAPLAEVPDAAFSGGGLGDGVAVDPTKGVLQAPCDGEVITVAATGHAIGLRHSTGAEILMHVGVDTVVLKGRGFQAHVAVGQAVRARDALLTFDLDVVAQGSRSLITPVLVSDMDRFEIVRRAIGLIGAGDVLLELNDRTAAACDVLQPAAAQRTATRFLCGLKDGVHARPAARIVAAAKATGAEITVSAHDRTTSALSALGLMGLEIRSGDDVMLEVVGVIEPGALAALEQAFAARPIPTPSPPLPAPPDARVLYGARGAPGTAIGDAFRYVAAEVALPAIGRGVAAETAALETALRGVGDRLNASAEAAQGSRGDILLAHSVLLDDPVLRDAAIASIQSGASAGASWRAALRRQADVFEAASDPRLRERRADLLDLERQVLAQLYGPAAETPKPPPGCIVLAEELLPSELAALAESSIAGVAMSEGGATSHVAIMAAALGLPMLVATKGLAAVPDGSRLMLDADKGRLVINPDDAAMAEVHARNVLRAHRRAAAPTDVTTPCSTADGAPIAIYANLGGGAEAARAIAEGAEGCGLLRSEFLFQDRRSPPNEDEQHAAYQAVADRLDGRPLTIRTLDIGADKPAPYLALPREANPALGVRGVRVSLQWPDLMRPQLRAILRVRGDVAILVPMVTFRDELDAVRALLHEEAAALGVAAPPLGVMIETPAAALTINALSKADFFSIGANDLTQYVLAVDRTQPALASRFDGLHPAVVALMRIATDAARKQGKAVSVCGGLAADPAAIPLLIGLGVTTLSTPPSRAGEVKALVRTLMAEDCRAFVADLDGSLDAAALRQAVAIRWPQVEDGA